MTDNEDKPVRRPFSTAAEDLLHTRARERDAAQTRSPAYRLAYDDDDFILSDDMRPVRLLLELSKPELTLKAHDIEHTIVMFGSARLKSPEAANALLQAATTALAQNPDDPQAKQFMQEAERARDGVFYYEQARELSRLITTASCEQGIPRLYIVTGGGPGIMEAANRGAADVGGESIGLNITLPQEQHPNPFITPELCFQFHYFAIRKMHFLMRAQALVVFPGGFGTLDELFETLTLIQTRKIKPLPILAFGKDYWQRLINFDLLVDEGMISAEDRDILTFVDSVEEAWDIIRHWLLASATSEPCQD
ncbi:MAG: TIGR00730 family Rossman fold protein [Pseudomonadales bacterium]|nr:TIGR00730 family Rossman fold protein [Pseudomonadales bacterium]